MKTESIYIPLLDEGVNVWRPTDAVPLGGGVYRVLATPSYDPDDEKWAFPPGSFVIGEPKQLSGETVLAAARSAPVSLELSRLMEEVAYINAQWRLFKHLFMHDERRAKVLTELTPTFFRQVEVALINEVLMGLSRITDRQVLSGNDTLVLSRLIGPSPSKAVQTVLRRMAKLMEPLRDMRNQVLAHLNRAVAMGEQELTPPHLKTVGHAVRLAVDLTTLLGVEQFRSFVNLDTPALEHEVDWIEAALLRAAADQRQTVATKDQMRDSRSQARAG